MGKERQSEGFSEIGGTCNDKTLLRRCFKVIRTSVGNFGKRKCVIWIGPEALLEYFENLDDLLALLLHYLGIIRQKIHANVFRAHLGYRRCVRCHNIASCDGMIDLPHLPAIFIFDSIHGLFAIGQGL